MLPLVLKEQHVHPFNFYLDGQVRVGMRHGLVLYALVDSFYTDRRLAAYGMAEDLTRSGYSVLITVSQHYKVWVRLTAAQGLPLLGMWKPATAIDQHNATSMTAIAIVA